MRYSSAKQLSFDYDASASGIGPGSGPAGASSVTPEPLQELPRYDPVYAATSRIAGRINAASISEADHTKLLKERQALLRKKFDNKLSRKEENRLEYVRWSLDRVEDAKYGSVLEALDSAVTRYENILDELRALGLRLEDQLPKNRRR
jgi:hypothetical protein